MTEEPFTNKDLTLIRLLAIQNPAQVRSKLESSTYIAFPIHFPTLLFSTLPFPSGFCKLPTLGQQTVPASVNAQN